MDFFGLGFGEILMILVIVLLLFGPNRIPEIARNLGKTVRAFRQAASGFNTAVQRELNIEEATRPSPPPSPVSEVKIPGRQDPGTAGAAGPGDQRNANAKNG